MKKNIVFLLFVGLSLCVSAQELTTLKITDWNKLSKSCFIESTKVNNIPANHDWYWGINIGHNQKEESYYNGQIAFGVNFKVTYPDVYVRSTYLDGDGVWAKVVHCKGNHAIDGKLTAKEIEIKIDTGADFVFESDYQLPSLSEVENHIKENKHLPDIPSEKEMIENGVNVNEMQIKLLQKIEELTLYVIELDKKDKEKSRLIERQEKLIEELQNKLKD